MGRFNSECPLCGANVHLGHVSVYCGTPIGQDGWTLKLTDRETAEKAAYFCPKCESTVPADWIFKEMSLKEAQHLMSRWTSEPLSIHNRKGEPSKKVAARTAGKRSNTSGPTGSSTRKTVGTPKPTSSDAGTVTPPSSSTPSESTPESPMVSEDSIFA